MDDVWTSFLCSMYHMSERSLRQIFVNAATKMIIVLNPTFKYYQNVQLCMCHDQFELLKDGMDHWELKRLMCGILTEMTIDLAG